VGDFLLAGYIYAEDRHSPLHRLAALRSLLLGVLSFCIFQLALAPDPASANFWFQGILSGYAVVAVNFHFVWRWAGRMPRRETPLLLGLVYTTAALIVLLLAVSGTFVPRRHPELGWVAAGTSQQVFIPLLGILWVLVALLAASCYALHYYLGKRKASDHRQERYVVMGLLLPTILVICVDVFMRLAGFTIPILAPLWSLFGTVLIIYGIHNTHAFLLTPSLASRIIFGSVAQGVAIVNPDGQIEKTNPALCRLMGASTEELEGQTMRDMVVPIAPHSMAAAGENEGAEGLLHGRDGRMVPVLYSETPIQNLNGEVVGAVWMLTDITPRKRYEESLNEALSRAQHLATTDGLTGLCNRRHFVACATDLLLQARELNQPLCVLVMDIDHFKRINDSHGHAAGDEVLRAVAATCRLIMRSGDLLARMGGEEFAFLLPNTSLHDGMSVAERLRAAIASQDVSIAGASLRVTVSIGVTALDSVHDSLDQLLNHADQASYEAKTLGRNRVAVWMQQADVLTVDST
jgi:diguanylate cyclase (GGDEF)-like protein/PAS domain S-box-containing protein